MFEKDIETGYESFDADSSKIPDEKTALISSAEDKNKKDKKGSRCFFKGPKKRRIEKFYKEQEELLDLFVSDARLVEKLSGNGKGSNLSPSCSSLNLTEEGKRELRKDKLLAQATFGVNVLLLVVKGVVAYLTNSLSVISSVVDSAVDVTSGIIVWASAKAIEKPDPYKYPRGRSKLEPLAVVMVSVVMAVASLQMIIQSIQSMISGNVQPNIQLPSILIMVVVILVKIVLFIICWRRKTPSGQVLAVDHRNDCVSNTVAIICAYLADISWVYIDPIGAILVSLYIIATWFVTGAEQVRLRPKSE